ncbi:MAG: ferredoxin--NADP reductase, partial [Thermoplasmata archaeon]
MKRVVTIASNTTIAPEVHLLDFALPPDEVLRFVPGQFVTFYVLKETKTLTRSYSIASEPDQTGRFELIVKRVDDGYVSTLLCRLTPGQRMTMLGPLGKFLLRDPGGRTVVF